MKQLPLFAIGLMTYLNSTAQDFTLMTLPDIQNMTWSGVDQNLYNEMQWIIDTEEQLNTKFVVSLGDLTADGYTAISPHSQWNIAKKSSDMLIDAGLPYAVCTGNHDMDHVPAYEIPTQYTRFNEYYPVSDFENKSYFGGYHRDMSNGYYLFSASGMDFIVVVLQNYQESAYDPAVATWANQILTEHADRRAIISTHMLYEGNEYMTNIIEKHDNVFMAVYGHHCADNGERYWTSQTPSGNPIYCMMSDYQCRHDEGGGAVARYYTFKPEENKVYAYTYSTYKQQYETDASSQFTFDYQMVRPEEPGISRLGNIPVYPKSNEDVIISALVTDNVSVAGATLHWGLSVDDLSESIAMVGQEDDYVASLRAHPDQTVVYYQVEATDDDGNVTLSEVMSYLVENDESKLPCPYNSVQSAYQGAFNVLPGKIEAEDYNEGCEGIAYKDNDADNNGGQYRSETVDIENCSDVGGGYNIGWTQTGEFTAYKVDVEATGLYDFRFRVASETAADGSFQLSIDNELVIEKVTIPSTGGWQDWETVEVVGVALSKGEHDLKMVVEEGDYNLNFFEADLSLVTTGSGLRMADNTFKLFYDWAAGSYLVSGVNTKVNYQLYDVSGRMLIDGVSSSNFAIDLNQQSPGMYLLRIESATQLSTHRLLR